MASVIARLGPTAFKKHAKQFTPGAVLPIDRFQSTDRSFATELSHGGALYLVVADAKNELWLVAVLEAPETSGIRIGDKREPGWYAPVNTTPVTNISKLRKKLAIGKDLARALPCILTPEMDGALRQILDAVDAPLVGHVEATPTAPVLDAKLPPLDRAARYLASGHVSPAIQALLEAWRASRVPALADLIDRATRLTPEYHRPLFDKRMNWKDEAAATKIWAKALASDPVNAMPQLLLNLAVGGLEGAITNRTKRLAKLPVDPRVGIRLAELVSYRPSWDSDRWWRPIVDLWLASRDARLFETIHLVTDDYTKLGAEIEAMTRTAPPELAVEERPLVAKIEAELHRLEEPVRTEQSLVDQIAAHPDDDGPYLVYADWLMERGRPLGELVTLSCQQRAGSLTPAQARRLSMLLEIPYVCGAFDDMPSSRLRKRERGIDRQLAVYWSTQPRSWRVFATSPLSRALNRIDLVGNPVTGREEAIADFIRAAPALDTVADIGNDAGQAIAKLLGNTFEVRTIKRPRKPDDYGVPATSVNLVRVTRAGRSR